MVQGHKLRDSYSVVKVDDATRNLLLDRRAPGESLYDAFRRHVCDGAAVESAAQSGRLYTVGRASCETIGFKVWPETTLRNAIDQIRQPGEGLSAAAKRAILAAIRLV